ncbi:MAG TPA: TRAP transporter substrate-binding protein [Burkholderiales bacterium]|nr:TRAP transporter substrate-binding protein [Burkholderiales bacterium]
MKHDVIESVALKFGGYQKPASIHNQAAMRFGELLRERLGSRVAFELIGNVLDRGRQSGDLPVMVESGELSCCYISTVRFTRWVPELAVIDLPFVVRDRPNVQRALSVAEGDKGTLGAYFKRRFDESSPFRLLGLWDNGFRHLTNKVRPIRTPADCRGLKMRTQMSASHGEALAALGFVPIPADVKEFTEQIGGERFDAQDNPLTNIYNFGVHQYHRYITLSGHFFGASAMICNAAHYASWPADLRKAFDECALVATAYQHQLAAKEDEAIRARLDPRENELIELTPAERAAFVSAMEPILNKYRGKLDTRLFDLLAGGRG